MAKMLENTLRESGDVAKYELLNLGEVAPSPPQKVHQ